VEFAIDTVRSPLVATGTVRQVDVFGQQGVQQTNEAGMPLWDIDVMVPAVQFGKAVTEIVAVRVPAKDLPQVAQYQPLPLEHPVVSFYVSKGQLRTNISAAGIAGTPARGRQSEAA
jgi:hypothetical protein